MSETYNHAAAGADGDPYGPLVLGIDAGGTRSRACLTLAHPGARVLGRGSGGPGNALSVARADLTRHLSEAIGEAIEGAVRRAAAGPAGPGAGRPGAGGRVARAAEEAGRAETAAAAGPGSVHPAAAGPGAGGLVGRRSEDAARAGIVSRVAAAYGGFAGAAPGVGPERGEELARSCLRDALGAHGIRGVPVGVGGDTDVALAAAPGAPADGLVLIAGTGAIAARLVGGRRAAVSDGHGWLLGDEGSGFWLGGHAARAALEALDGRGPWTSLVPRVVSHYLGRGPDGAPRIGPDSGAEARHLLGESLVARAYEEPPARLGALSPAVVEAAGEGDEVALRLLDEAAGLLAGTVRSLAPRAGEPLVTTGGLLGPSGPLLSRVTASLAACGLRVFPVPDGCLGAAALACTLR